MTTVKNIQQAIRKAINRHLVMHVQVGNDQRDRIEILTEEAANEIKQMSMKKQTTNTEGNSYYNCGVQYLWEILVPTQMNDGTPIRTKFHKVWDEKVRTISKGLTVLMPVKGQWLNEEESTLEEQLFSERMIPVRIKCTEDNINKIAVFCK